MKPFVSTEWETKFKELEQKQKTQEDKFLKVVRNVNTRLNEQQQEIQKLKKEVKGVYSYYGVRE